MSLVLLIVGIILLVSLTIAGPTSNDHQEDKHTSTREVIELEESEPMLTIWNSQPVIENVAVSVFTGKAFYDTRAACIKATWGKCFKHLYYHGCTPNLALPVRTLTYDNPHQEDYHSALYKCILGLKALWEDAPGLEWYWSSGCDTFVHPFRLQKALSQYSPDDLVYIGGELGVRPVGKMQVTYANGGPGFALSRSLMKQLYHGGHFDLMLDEWVNHSELEEYLIPACDVCMGWYLKKEFDVDVIDLPGLYFFDTDWYERNQTSLVEEPIAFHRIGPGRMEAMFELAQKNCYPFSPTICPPTPSIDSS